MSKSLPALFTALTIVLGTIPTHFSVVAASSDSSASPTAEDNSADIPTSDTDYNPISITPYDLLKTHLSIKSLNPGFKIADLAETGEAIELANSADISLPLEHVSLRYINSSGTKSTIFEFPSGSYMIGETILLRYEKSPEIKNALVESKSYLAIADATYAKTLAMTGTLELIYMADSSDEQIIDTICWTGKSGCNAKFTTSNPGSLVRNPETQVFEFSADYVPNFIGGLKLPEPEPEPEFEPENDELGDEAVPKLAQCHDLEFNEILSYYESDKSEQFIELFNPTDQPILLSGCQLKYKNKSYDLVETNVSTENIDKLTITDFYVYRTNAFTLTRNPNSENVLELVDTTSEIFAELSYPHGQKKGAAYALSGDVWQITYLPTPGAANVFQEFKTCPLGKIINETTGNCVKVTAATNTITPCPTGKYRNPATGRCKNLSSSSEEQKTCKEGYERNPETGRCRKIKVNDGADYALVPITGEPEKSSFVAIWALAAVGALGLGYVIFQFRREILYSLRHLITKFKK